MQTASPANTNQCIITSLRCTLTCNNITKTFLIHVPQHLMHVPQTCYITSSRSSSNMHQYHQEMHLIYVPKYVSHHPPKMCLKHIPFPQQDTKGMTITSPTCNQDVPQTMCLKYVPTFINHVPGDTIKHVANYS
jgi:hypothetical protein